MTENAAIDIIKTELAKTISGFKVEVIEREFISISKYRATIVALMRENSVTPAALLNVRDRLANDGISEIELRGTRRDLKELDFEIMTFEVEIIL